MYTLTSENAHNLGVYRIIEISLVLCNAYIIPKDHDKFMFYVNNYLNQDQFKQLDDPNQIDKVIKNIDVVTHKLRSALTRVTNYRLKVISAEKQKREEIIEKQKTKAIATKHQRAKEQINLFSNKKRNYESDIRDKTNPEKVNNEYPLQL